LKEVRQKNSFMCHEINHWKKIGHSPIPYPGMGEIKDRGSAKRN